MKNPMNPRSLRLSTLGVLFAAVALTACEKRDVPPQPKVEPDTTIGARTEPKVDEARADARAGMDNAKESARDVGRDIAAAGREAQADVKQAGAQAAEKVADAVITTKVTAEFARDSGLSATKIDVDTNEGRVALHGTARSAADRERATTIASAIKGVKSVDNRLTVEPARM